MTILAGERITVGALILRVSAIFHLAFVQDISDGRAIKLANCLTTHAREVAKIVYFFGFFMDWPDEKRLLYTIGGAVHDVPKIEVGAEVWAFEGNLKENEEMWKEAKSHVTNSIRIMKAFERLGINWGDLPLGIRQSVAHHHRLLEPGGEVSPESYYGFPDIIPRDNSIPEGVQVVAMADRLEAATSFWRKTGDTRIKAMDEIMAELAGLADSGFVDSELCDQFRAFLKEFRASIVPVKRDSKLPWGKHWARLASSDKPVYELERRPQL